jgi:hypothetical protein
MCIALWRTEGMSIALGALRAWRLQSCLQWGSTGRGVAASGSALPWRRQLPLAARNSKAAGKAASAAAQWADRPRAGPGGRGRCRQALCLSANLRRARPRIVAQHRRAFR